MNNARRFLLWLGVTALLAVLSCVTTGSLDKASDTDRIANSLKSHLKSSLEGKSAKLFGGSESSDDDDGSSLDDDDYPDDDDDNYDDDDDDTGDGDGECCEEGDPCHQADNGVCDCRDMDWDREDCKGECCLEEDPCFWSDLTDCLCPQQDWNYTSCLEPCCSSEEDTCGWADSGLCDCPDRLWDRSDCQPVEIDTEPVCVEDLSACEPPDETPDWNDDVGAEVLAFLDLGWYDETPPEAKEEPRSRLCFDGTVRLESRDSSLIQFGIAQDESIAAFILVLQDLSGFALLPLNSCGQVEFPGTAVLCDGIEQSVTIPLAAQGALVTFEREVGPYLDFEILVVCR